MADIKLLGICGREGAGKTTVANILTNGEERFFMREITEPMSYILHILFGFRLEDPMNSHDSIWWENCYYKVKDLLEKYIDSNLFPPGRRYKAYFRYSETLNNSWMEFGFADALKQIASIIFDLDFNMLLAQTPEDRKRRETEKTRNFNKCGSITGRYALEFLGTEVFRNNFDDDIWIKIAKRNSSLYISNGGKVVFPDLRFPNELNFIEENNGTILLIFRDFKDLLITNDDKNSHPSKWKFLEFCGSAKNLIIFHNRSIEFMKSWVNLTLKKCKV